MKPGNDPALAVKKALVALAFRNGPIEDVHAGKLCPTWGGQPGVLARLGRTDEGHHEIGRQQAVLLSLGMMYSTRWDDPEI